MGDIQLLDIINVVIACVTGALGWFVGRRKWKNDFLIELQNSINMLADKNATQMEEIIKLREEVVNLRDENAKLRKEVGTLNEKLGNVKTITKKA